MEQFNRISSNPEIMGGKACIKGTRVTVGNITGLLSEGYSNEDVIDAYPFLKVDDILAALKYATWRIDEREFDLVA